MYKERAYFHHECIFFCHPAFPTSWCANSPCRPDTAVACLHVKFQLGESLQRHMSHEPSVGAHERSHRPIASVKSVYSAAPRVSDPNPPHIPATTALLSPYHPTPTPNTSSTPPFFLSSLRQSEPKSLYICSTWLLPSI